MALSNTWNTATEIYKTNKKVSDMSKLIYRDLNGFEAFVTGEDNETYHIEGNDYYYFKWRFEKLN